MSGFLARDDSIKLIRSGEVGKYGAIQDSSDDDPELAHSMSVRLKFLGLPMAVFFLVMIIINTVVTPYTLKLTGLVAGLTLMVAIGTAFSYAGIILGKCWNALQRRWPEKYNRARAQESKPYCAIAMEASGAVAKRVIQVSLWVACFGTSVACLLLAMKTLSIMTPHSLTNLQWVLICAAVAAPMVLLGAPLDSWLVGLAGCASALLASVILLVSLTYMVASDTHIADDINILNTTENSTFIESGEVTFETFWIGTSLLIFLFGGLTMFPSVQRDTREPEKWSVVVVAAFAIVGFLYITTGVTGFLLFRERTPSHISDGLRCFGVGIIPTVTQVANGLLVCLYIVQTAINLVPITQDIEGSLDLGSKVNFRHIAIRLLSFAAVTAVSAGYPSFHHYMALIGACSMALMNLIAPSYFYLRLFWKEVSKAEVVVNFAVIFLGLLAAVVGTYVSVRSFFNSSVTQPAC